MAEFVLPYQSGWVTLTSHYGKRILNGKEDYHNGIDLCGTDKTLVSPCDGVIGQSTIIMDKSNLTWQWGNYVRIDRADGLKIYMCHMAERRVKAGQKIKAGEVVGVEGNTGYSFGSHVHFEVRKNGVAVNPCPYLGVKNDAWTKQIQRTEDYADLVCEKCGFEPKTREYLNGYRFSPDLWRKLWFAMR